MHCESQAPAGIYINTPSSAHTLFSLIIWRLTRPRVMRLLIQDSEPCVPALLFSLQQLCRSEECYSLGQF